MRGKISYYNEKTQTGTVVDKARIVYEFKSSSWFDHHRLPMADMYVDFKANEHGKIEQIKESIFLRLQRKYDVTEADFWQSADEETLEDIAIARREKLINENVLNIVPKPIAEDYAIGDCFLAFFADAVELVYRYENIAFDESAQDERLDYFKLKRFMQKAKSQLAQTDGTIQMEPFNQMEKELSELEFVISETLKQKTKSMELLFEEIYLSQQIGYLKVQRRLKVDKQRAFELNITIKRAKENIAAWKSRLSHEHGTDAISSLESKIAHAVHEYESAEKEIQEIEKNKIVFSEHLKNFKESKYREFSHSFGFETELKGIVDALKTIVERIAFDYDTLLWQCAVSSHIVQNTFYRQSTEGNYCAMTFLRYYLKPLNKHALSKPDEALYHYLLKYDTYIAKQALVLCEDREKMNEISLIIYGARKDVVVHQFLRAVDSLHWVRTSRAAFAVFDEKNHSLSPKELAESYASAHPDENFNIIVFNSQKSGTVKFSQNIEIIRVMEPYNLAELKTIILQMLG